MTKFEFSPRKLSGVFIFALCLFDSPSEDDGSKGFGSRVEDVVDVALHGSLGRLGVVVTADEAGNHGSFEPAWVVKEGYGEGSPKR